MTPVAIILASFVALAPAESQAGGCIGGSVGKYGVVSWDASTSIDGIDAGSDDGTDPAGSCLRQGTGRQPSPMPHRQFDGLPEIRGLTPFLRNRNRNVILNNVLPTKL